ncbi:MAG: aminoglycoside phosphotransferase family protein [Meiothermus sp.]|uniref:phosphotransferase family protein n=1 Tax=Meiothermus sp. TaxID=1955249 RepID=UPI0028CDEBC8|nr:aminoglycoside phosphotransferase family protein [Meiothermus sp.]MDT7919082.1 aminoglycoside phosphotransferase family protein [Meiothermus sp.]
MLLMRLGQGREAEVFAWADGYVLKLFWPEFSQEDAELEARLTQQVWLLGVPSPRVEDVLEFEGRWGLVLEWIRGVPLTEYIQANPDRLRFAAQMLGALQRQLHSKAAGHLPSQRLHLIQRIQACRLPEAQREALLQHLEQLPDGSVLCHGDFHPENVLLGEQGVFVVDWPNVTRGNPMADIARTTLLMLYSELPHDLPAREEIMHQRQYFYQTYLEHYQNFSGLDMAQLRAWMPIVAAARLRENIPHEEPRLMRLIQEGLQERSA